MPSQMHRPHHETRQFLTARAESLITRKLSCGCSIKVLSVVRFPPELEPHLLPHNYHDSVRLSSRTRCRTRTVKAGGGKRPTTRTRPGVIRRTSSSDGYTRLRTGSQFAAVVSRPPSIDPTCSNISSSSRDLRVGFEDKCLPTRIKQAQRYRAQVDETLQKIQVRRRS